ncbi:MAG: hypothetical protein QG567_1156 [Campylobacterota bacterium]|nr:hypothetical protein [Campylobacterota bacterium]
MKLLSSSLVFLFFALSYLESAQWIVDESPRKRTWEEAVDYCDFKGGKLPTIKELKNASLNPIKEAFKKDYYWSSTEYFGDPEKAYYVNFYDSSSHYSPKTFKMYVRCVKK